MFREGPVAAESELLAMSDEPATKRASEWPSTAVSCRQVKDAQDFWPGDVVLFDAGVDCRRNGDSTIGDRQHRVGFVLSVDGNLIDIAVPRVVEGHGLTNDMRVIDPSVQWVQRINPDKVYAPFPTHLVQMLMDQAKEAEGGAK